MKKRAKKKEKKTTADPRNPLGLDYSFWGTPEAMNVSLKQIAFDAMMAPDSPYPEPRYMDP